MPSNLMSSNPQTTLEEFRLHNRFEYKIYSLARLMKNRWDEGVEEHGITRVQWVALTSIAIEKKRSPSDLAEHIGVSRPSISRMLKQMESAGLIERSPIGDDGRSCQLALTDKGHKCMKLCWPHVRESEQFFLHKLNDSQREALFLAIQALIRDETEAPVLDNI